MRHYIILFSLFYTATIYSQNTSSINGKLVDKEYNNEPLAFANVSINGTIIETTTNLDGSYSFENLNPNEYILIYSFVGYETQEINVIITTKKTIEVNVSMKKRTYSPLDGVVTDALKKQKHETKLPQSRLKHKQTLG